MRNYSLSANIGTGMTGSDRYIVTPNARKVTEELVNNYHCGIHSFIVVGTYGTGKSSFLLELERNLSGKGKGNLLASPSELSESKSFDIINIVGEYASLEKILASELGNGSSGEDALDLLTSRLRHLKGQGKMLVLVVDEFGKVLEHAAKNDPEKELYFIQKLAEKINDPRNRALLIATLHQNFSAYSSKLNTAQKNEWAKVKGRFKELVFAEPVEQLLYMAAESLSGREVDGANQSHSIWKIARDSGYISSTLDKTVMQALYPLDAFSAVALTRAIQRYGQNERSLFSFLNTKGSGSITEFNPSPVKTYSLSVVYDYIVANFYSSLNEGNSDSMAWSAILVAIERVESIHWKDEKQLRAALNTVKAIGVLNLFGNAGFKISRTQFETYMSLALEVAEASFILDELLRLKIIRYAEYKGRYILFEGTDINIEDEVTKAESIVPLPANPVDDLRLYFNNRVAPVKAYYYHRGTPRYFEYSLYDAPVDITPNGDIDGYVEIIFPSRAVSIDELKEFSANCAHAIILAVFNHTDKIIAHLHKVRVYDHILENVLIDKSDRVALGEIIRLKNYEQGLLNKALKDSMFSFSQDVNWVFGGDIVKIDSRRTFNSLLSAVCEKIYPETPVINNELINRHKLSGTISAARAKYLQALTTNGNRDDLGFDKDKFPPEKTIYYTLLKNTGLHSGGEFCVCPTDKGVQSLWNACEKFLNSTREKPRKISELIKILSEQPYKIKMGVLDYWIPTYLYIKRLDYSLFGVDGRYVPEINMEFFDLLKKHPSDFSLKAYSEDGVHLAFYNQYRKFINVESGTEIRGDKFIETVKPFFFFYNHLNDYAKHTRKFDHITTLRFRDVLSKAKDPEKTFFEDLPEALGYDKTSLGSDEFVADYCSIIQRAVRELRSCYRNLIDRIEARLVESLDLQSPEYQDYVVEIRNRLSHIKPHLLSEKQRDFYNHAMAQFSNRQEWYQSICYAAMDQPLERLRDEQEEQLVDNLVFLFRECEKHSVVSEAMAYTVDENEKRISTRLEAEIEALLTDNPNLNAYVLMNLLKKRML